MIKDEIGRRRYILFSVDGKASRTDLIYSMNNHYHRIFNDENVPWLTVYTGDKGIVRCLHTQQEDIVQLINNIANETFSLTSCKTSGTIKKLKKEIRN